MTETTHNSSNQVLRSRIKTCSIFGSFLGTKLAKFPKWPQEYK